ncbi:hypothetical protein JTB14_036849 [Gonioctena quinquepunctata]|nr:hypothetical protein JTB14_036849 [Gonioctena quinquepunctata]
MLSFFGPSKKFSCFYKCILGENTGVVVKKDGRKFTERKHFALDTLEYQRKGDEPGLILIFNQENFLDPDVKQRRGSRRDVNEIVICFQRQGFNIDEENILTDCGREIILAKLKETAESDLAKYNSLIVFFLTHGDEFNKLHVYDDCLTTNEVWLPFRRCKTLVNKPKMFIFQACKGEDFSTTGKSTSPTTKRRESTCTAVPFGTFSTNFLTPDMLVVYSTIEGNVSFRHSLNGSWFIQELCKNFSAYGKRDDVISLIIRTTKCVCSNYFHYEETEFKKQMPMFVSTLTRKFYLNRNKDRSLLLNVLKTNEEILKEVKVLKDKVDRLMGKEEDKKKKK